MAKIDDLIKTVSSTKVQYCKVFSLVSLNDYHQIGASELEALNKGVGNIKLLPSSRNYDWSCSENDCDKSLICDGTVIAMGRARHANIKYYSGRFISSNNILIHSADTNVLLDRFLFHFLDSKKEEIYVETSTYPKFDMDKFKELQIPLPSVSVQREIIQILDNFSELTAELTAELSLRKSQYNFYASSLFPSIDDSDKWVELGKIATVTKLAGFEFTEYVRYSDEGKIIALRGLNVKNGHLILDDVKYIDNSQLEMLNRSKLVSGDLLYTYVGTVGQVAIVEEDDKFYLAPNVALIRIKNINFMPKFVMYYLLTDVFKAEQVNKMLQASSMQNIPMEKIRLFKIPTMSIDEQKRIISILDNFDTFISDITCGLPAEIELRNKQYSYYREKLFEFKMEEKDNG